MNAGKQNVITYEVFEKWVNKIKSHMDHANKVYTTMREIGLSTADGDFFDWMIDDEIELLEYICDDERGMIKFFIFELDFGERWTDAMIGLMRENGIRFCHRLKTVSDLWCMLGMSESIDF